MNGNQVSAVLFARDQENVAAFYVAVIGAETTTSDANHTSLTCASLELIVHQIPGHLLPPMASNEPVQRRERGAIRLDYPVADLARARREAIRLGGSIDAQPPPWARGDTSFFLGQDPEGNVFGVKVRP
jgi:predicted enzyme related to lactoylglutathione lyase